ncbi:hypothetical protein [Blautia wexlerae]|uniref:hypothetical protein n=1 Tax=Blautia wexlerae TaxID=418240 RepID=UPI0018AC6F97|nr:hypothetical protein [Blautia wexlerae]MDB2178136.1 hypothetical protein [Blautia wexlerae]MDB6441485.1 hypothetical protein [Blautia wexlerae]
MDWNAILKEVISGSILIVVGGIAGWFGGLFKGKKESSRAIERKNEIYQPLIDEIEKYSDFDWTIREKIKVPFLKDIVNNSYKYGIRDEILDQCNYLFDIINDYNSVDSIKVAHSIIVSIFEKGYAEIYGSIVDGISYQSDRDGNEWEEEIIAEPIQVVRQSNYSKEIENLLYNEGMYSDEVCVDEENAIYMPIYIQLKRIYHLALNVIVNGKEYIKPKPTIELNILPEEYIALHYDFFEIYNNDERIKKKYELREEIIYMSQAIVQSLKETIDQIIKIYEAEEL